MTQAPERHHLLECMLIGRDDTGQPRAIDLRGMTIELVIPVPKAHSGTADLERRLDEAREGLQFYADAASYVGKGRGKPSPVAADKGDVARDTLQAISNERNE